MPKKKKAQKAIQARKAAQIEKRKEGIYEAALNRMAKVIANYLVRSLQMLMDAKSNGKDYDAAENVAENICEDIVLPELRKLPSKLARAER